MDAKTRMALKQLQRDAQDRAWNKHFELPQTVDLFQLEATLFDMLLNQQGWKYDNGFSLRYTGEMGPDGIGTLAISEYENGEFGEPDIAYFCLVLGEDGRVSIRLLPSDSMTVGQNEYMRILLRAANMARVTVKG